MLYQGLLKIPNNLLATLALLRELQTLGKAISGGLKPPETPNITPIKNNYFFSARARFLKIIQVDPKIVLKWLKTSFLL